METTHFTFADFEKVRQAAQKEIAFAWGANRPPSGWSIHPADPAKLLHGHACLKLKDGLALRAYYFNWGNGGVGKVWALPNGAEFPDPAKPALPQKSFWNKLTGSEPEALRPAGFDAPPKPPAALADFTDALVGDGTPWSYLCASILVRDLARFAETWHNKDWLAHTLLDATPETRKQRNPWKTSPGAAGEGAPKGPPSPLSAWTTSEPEPAEWRPSVAVAPGETVVTFFTYCGKMREGYFRHVDRFKPGAYAFRSEEKKIAEGMGGYHA